MQGPRYESAQFSVLAALRLLSAPVLSLHMHRSAVAAVAAVQRRCQRVCSWSCAAGVHNLHGMPGVLGGLVPIIVLLLHGHHQAACAQAATVGATVGVATVGGALCALLVCALPSLKGEALTAMMYDDSAVFELEGDEGSHDNADGDQACSSL